MKIAAFEVHDYEDKYFAHSRKAEVCLHREILTKENVSLVKGYEGVCILGHSIIDRALMEELKKAGVKYVATRTIGYNHIDVKAAKQCGIRISNAHYDPCNVADFTVMLMLMLLRKAKISVIRALVNDFSLDEMCGRELRSLTVGIVGAGKVGRKVIQNLSGFGCKILVHDPFVDPEDLPAYVKCVTLDEILKNSDLLSLHIPFTEETKHLLNRERIATMKRGALLVNTARGELIDTDALVEAIESGQIGGAGIDTIEDEENVCHVDLGTQIVARRDIFYLKQFPNVIYTPHQAFFTEEAAAAMVESSLESLELFANDRPNPYEIKY